MTDSGERPSAVAVGLTPSGIPTLDFPINLPIPRRLVVREGVLEIDGWRFLFPGPRATILLQWFARTMFRWSEQDPSKENQRWLEGVVEAVESELRGE